MVSTGAKLDVSTWDGTLSSCEFRLSAIAFAERWKRFNSAALPHWLWISSSNLPWIAANEAEGYLSLEDVILNGHTEDNHDEGCHTEEEEPSYSGQDDTVDDAILVGSYGHEVHHYDFHMVYSSSYRVPVLYFRGYCSDGQPLALGDIEKDLLINSAKVLMESKWTFITQEIIDCLCFTSPYPLQLFVPNAQGLSGFTFLLPCPYGTRGTPLLEQAMVHTASLWDR
ncbi:ubiquitin-like-conjugating enzyme ATG10 isoform X2 [Diospyros lotus]|uniref:ubiquitin-like-conjugating enzyme ATG10 isoform X2 n=1 Tax=Diospyros lotus TaxID=55363 RepID=UPI00225B70E4|nr:ubiquitin-like-conjugating enzyme ATG10 isoform X2 [Diospyros lotus]